MQFKRAGALLSAILLSSSASATVFVNHPWEGAPNGIASRLTGQQVADDFTLGSNDTVRVVTWSGFNTPSLGNQAPPAVNSTLAFQFRLFNDVASPPAQPNLLNHRPANAPFVDVAVTATVMSVDSVPFESSTAYKVNYQSVLATPVALAGSTPYWISILSIAPTHEFDWLQGHTGGALVFRGPGIGDGSSWHEAISGPDPDVVFALDNVPEPCMGFVAMGAIFFALGRTKR